MAINFKGYTEEASQMGKASTFGNADYNFKASL